MKFPWVRKEAEGGRPRVRLFSPLPPKRSGISAYTYELLPFLRERLDLELVIADDQDLSELNLFGLPTRRWNGGDWVRDAYDRLHIYQLGNNLDHEYCYKAALMQPGVVVLHDMSLHYLVQDVTLAKGDGEGYRAALIDEYGGAGADLFDLRQLGFFHDDLFVSLRLTQHVIRRNLSVIVHNDYALERTTFPEGVLTATVNHHAAPDALGYDMSQDRNAIRRRLGLPIDKPVILSLGFVTKPKLVHKVVEALAVLREEGYDFFYAICGEVKHEEVLEKIQQNGLQDHVRTFGYLSEKSFYDFVFASDFLVNLRFPVVGETSGTLLRSLAMGLPAIVTSFGPSAEYPDSCVLKVPYEPDRPWRLMGAIRRMLEDPDGRGRMSAQARAYIRAHFQPEQTAAAYAEVVRAVADQELSRPLVEGAMHDRDAI